MNFKDLLALARLRLSDQTSPSLWSDDFLKGAYNEAIDEACLRARGILDSLSPMCILQVNKNQQRYKLDPRIIKVERVQMTRCDTPLEATTIRWLDENVQQWNAPNRAGEPQWFYLDQDRSKQLNLNVVPYPRFQDQANLSVWRMPLDSEYLDKPSDCPPIPLFLHRGLVDWVEHVAYANNDSETYDEERSEKALAKFEARFGPRPTGHALKVMAVNAARATRSCFF